MWDGVREWGLAILAVLGAVFTPVAYVMGLRTEIKVLETKFEQKFVAMEQIAFERERVTREKQESIEKWLLRVEGKLDRVLFKQE